MFNYKPYLESLANFMNKNGYPCNPFPKVILDNSEQDPVFGYTGYFDPQSNSIRLFVNKRLPKDVLRSFAHEWTHFWQNQKGDIEKSGYSGDKITEDKNLIHLEAEAYLKGNMAFRAWTETTELNKKNRKHE